MVLQVSADTAIEKIEDGDAIGLGGFVAVGIAERILGTLGQHFEETGHPKDLTIYHPAAEGDMAGAGLDHLAHPEMIERILGSHWGFVPDIMDLIMDNEVEAYNFPFGVMDQLIRDTGAGKPGTISNVGLRTFADPRQDGGKANDVTEEQLVEVVELGGEEQLFYHAQPLDVAIVRGTTADENGNIMMEREALHSNHLAMARAAANNDGIVIAQVERVTKTGSRPPKDVLIPGVMVDYVVTAPETDHPQTYAEPYSPEFSGEVKRPSLNDNDVNLDERKVIARRAAMELEPDSVINLGVGVPETIPPVAAEGGIGDEITQTVESGPIGGSASGGINFGTAVNHEALVTSPQQFDFYDGGGLDFGFLGMAQIDPMGNVNVSKFEAQIPGCGGFPNITQNAEKVVYGGTLTAEGLEVNIGGGEIVVEQEGDKRKFLDDIEQITFSGEYAVEVGQEVVYVTERSVFELREEGLTLVEVAPGLDPIDDVADQMEFEPNIADSVDEMVPELFEEGEMDLTEYVF
jgi:propionate CoA-transferase